MSPSHARPLLIVQPDSSVLDMIGRTPLVRLRHFEHGISPDVELYAKAEWQNPGGSVKDRAAARMILDGEASGKLTRGKTILDATSGNTGIAYAMVGAARGYKVRFACPENASPERKLILQALGAELMSDQSARRHRRRDSAKRGACSPPIPTCISIRISTTTTPTGTRITTRPAPEIIEQTSGTADAFCRRSRARAERLSAPGGGCGSSIRRSS